jgi:hypothetical protein
MAFTEADIAADVGVMVEGEPAGIRCECHQHSSVPAFPPLTQRRWQRWLRTPCPTTLSHACPCHCSEAALEGMCEALYNDSVKVLKQAALFLLSQEEEERDGPPGGLPCG